MPAQRPIAMRQTEDANPRARGRDVGRLAGCEICRWLTLPASRRWMEWTSATHITTTSNPCSSCGERNEGMPPSETRNAGASVTNRSSIPALSAETILPRGESASRTLRGNRRRAIPPPGAGSISTTLWRAIFSWMSMGSGRGGSAEAFYQAIEAKGNRITVIRRGWWEPRGAWLGPWEPRRA